jgi:hypothetical protein
MYDYRHEFKKGKFIKECAECGERLQVGEEVYVIGNKVYCSECVRKTELEEDK